MKKRLLALCLLPFALWWVTSVSCTNAKLYAENYVPNEASLTGVVGDLCTDNPSGVDFPLKIAIMVDSALGGAVPDDRGPAIAALVNQYKGSNVEFDIILMQQAAQSYTMGFTNDTALIQNAVSQVNGAVSPLRNYEAAVLQVTTDIENDMIATSPGVLSRTHYAIIFAAQESPDPDLPTEWCVANMEPPDTTQCTNAFSMNYCPGQVPPPADCELQVYVTLMTQLATFIHKNGALDLIAHFYEVGTDMRTQVLLSAMSLAAKGDFGQASPGKLNLLDTPLLDPDSTFQLREFVVWNANALLRGGKVVADSDGDGLSDEEEALLQTDPNDPDTDHDGVGDKIEHDLQSPGSEFNPLVFGTFVECVNLHMPFPDTDGDGLNDCEEAVEGTSPYLQDTDLDGLPDGLEVLRGIFPLVDDRLYDTDGDGMLNGLELRQGTDPNTNDSAAAVLYAYTNSVVGDQPDGGISVVLNIDPEFPVPGVAVESVSGMVGGTMQLAVFPGPPLQMATSDVGSMAVGTQVDVSAGGLFTLISPSGTETVVEVDAMTVEEAVGAEESVAIAVSPTNRACYHISVQNIKLVATNGALMEGSDGGEDGGTFSGGTNLIHISMAQTLNGAVNAPTVYRSTTIPFEYIPPNTKTPGGAYVTVEQNDLATVITN